LSVVFFTDRDLGLQFPHALRTAGLTVERHTDHFPPACPDDVWLREVARRGWIAVTHDSRIRYKPNELAAVVRHKVKLRVLVGKAPYPTIAESFVATLPQVHEFLRAHTPPFIGKVYRATPAELVRDPTAAGRVELCYPKTVANP